MMISPESYYELHLKGKDEKEIRTEIRGLKQEIGHLKNVLENPYEEARVIMHPSELVRIRCSREYLSQAKKAFSETGGTYTPSRTEKKIIKFNENIPYISQLTFSIGGFFDGNTTYVVDLTESDLLANIESWSVTSPWAIITDDEEIVEKDRFIEILKEFHLGEWRPHYSTKRFGYFICDGTQWELKIEYSNDARTLEYSGDNSYPYNFDDFMKLFGIDNYFEDGEEYE